MKTRSELEQYIINLGARFVPKEKSRLMKIMGWLLKWIGNNEFISRYWTTIGVTIYYPEGVQDPLDHPQVVEHELIHVEQWKKWWILFSISYLFLPIPFGLAWCRWRWEREAYLKAQLSQADDIESQLDYLVQTLWKGYGWPWPKKWMKNWFLRELEKITYSNI